jgi:hypothetical protein
LHEQEEPSEEKKMKKRVPIFAALNALALAGCACPLFFVPPPPNKPIVSVVDGKYIVVSPEPLSFRPDGKPEEIVWSLPRTSNYRFPPNGIVIEGQVVEVSSTERAQTARQVPKRFELVPQTDIACDKQDGGQTYKCTNSKKTKGVFKYTIRVRDGGGNELPARDPTIVNEF